MSKFSYKDLKPKDIYKWPLKAQVIMGLLLSVIIFLLSFYFVLLDQYSDLDIERGKEEKLKIDFIDKTKQAVNLQLYKQQLVEISQASDALLKQLPNKSEVEKLLIDINQSGIGHGLQFELFRPNIEKVSEYYAELPISIKIKGSYDAIGKFASDISQLSRVVILKEIDIGTLPSTENNVLLTMSATAQTFRYLDQEEIEKQKIEKRLKNKKEINKKGDKQ